MIVGAGMLARAFAARFSTNDDVVVFASGVSNSAERAQAAFDRESALLRQSLESGRRLIYFSSCAVGNPHQVPTPYFEHKRMMEEQVLAEGQVVYRLPQVVGRSANPNTLTNFLHDAIVNARSFTLQRGVERNLIDVDHVAQIAEELLQHSPDALTEPVAIATPRSLPMHEIVAEFESVLNRKAVYTALERTVPFPIESRAAQESASRLGISFDENYLATMLRKYYG